MRKEKRRYRLKHKESVWPKLLLSVVTLLQIVLSILLHIMNRRETLRLIQEEDEMKVLVKAKKENRQL